MLDNKASLVRYGRFLIQEIPQEEMKGFDKRRRWSFLGEKKFSIRKMSIKSNCVQMRKNYVFDHVLNQWVGVEDIWKKIQVSKDYEKTFRYIEKEGSDEYLREVTDATTNFLMKGKKDKKSRNAYWTLVAQWKRTFLRFIPLSKRLKWFEGKYKNEEKMLDSKCCCLCFISKKCKTPYKGLCVSKQCEFFI